MSERETIADELRRLRNNVAASLFVSYRTEPWRNLTVSGAAGMAIGDANQFVHALEYAEEHGHHSDSEDLEARR